MNKTKYNRMRAIALLSTFVSAGLAAAGEAEVPGQGSTLVELFRLGGAAVAGVIALAAIYCWFKASQEATKQIADLCGLLRERPCVRDPKNN